MEKKNSLKYIYEISQGNKGQICLLIVSRSVIAFISVATALVLREIINAAIAHQNSLFFFYISILIAMICFRIIAGTLSRFLQEKINAQLENKCKKRFFATLLSKEYSYISTVHSGQWMTQLTNDTVIVANGITNILPDLAGMLVKLIGATGFILLMEPRFLYVFIPGIIILLAVSYLSRTKMKQLHKYVQEKDGNLRAFLQECFASMLIIRSYGVETLAVDKASVKMNEHQQARIKRNHFSNIFSTGFAILMNLTYLVGVGYCGYGILIGTISYGSFIAILQLVGQLQMPLANITGILPRYYAMISSVERLIEIEVLNDTNTKPRKTIKEILSIYQNQLNKLEMKNISFSYLRPVNKKIEFSNNQQEITFQNWNFEINKGEYIAITGPSGCGKSTLLKLMMGLYEPNQGNRYLYLNNQKVVLDSTWQNLFSYVPQGNYLMSGTIREIIAFSNQEQINDDKAIWQALSIACAKQFVEKLDKGLDTFLGERGAGLSEGQMQRLAIARAIFSNRPIMILDECSSALDDQTERQLIENLRLMTDHTVIIITHRPAALAICDKIYHVDNHELNYKENNIE